jgi:RNA polymerase sigma-70 factor (ECF subfamily)
MDERRPFERRLEAARAGEGWALAELFRDLHPRVLRYLRSLDPVEADGLASDTWLEVVHGLDRFRGTERDLRAYTFEVARGRLARRTEARPDVAVVLRDDDVVEDRTLEALGTEQALDRILTLPLEQAEVVLLRVLGGLTVEEVARLLDRRVGTVRLMQRNALGRLAEATSVGMGS